MSRRPWKPDKKSVLQVLWNLFLLSFGSTLCAVCINGILIPQHFFGAGFTGLALVMHYLAPSLPVAMLYFILNIPVFCLGWIYVGRRFFFYSIAGMFIFTCAMLFIHFDVPVHDKILSAILGGIITGVGAGVILKSLGSSGGLDILSVMLLKLFSIRIGTTILAFNSIVLAAGAILFSLEGALYTLIFIYVSSYMINLVVSGLSKRKAAFIISNQWRRISDEIIAKIGRTVTIIGGRGGYTGSERQLLYVVISFSELSRLKQLIRGVDPDVFMVVSDTLEVMGQRIGNQPHW